jgi:uncharacterized membrane protein
MTMSKQQAGRRMPMIFRVVRARVKLAVSFAFGVAAMLLTPSDWELVTRILLGWDAGVILYICIISWFIARLESRAEMRHIRARAEKEDEGKVAVLVLTVTATLASLAAIVILLGQGEGPAAPPQLVFASATIILSWAFVHLIFATHYAHEFYSEGGAAGGLKFPGGEKPDYLDFIYFSYVIGMTFQVSDVGVTSRSIRQTVLAHAIVSFLFNVALLAIVINIAAGAIRS